MQCFDPNIKFAIIYRKQDKLQQRNLAISLRNFHYKSRNLLRKTTIADIAGFALLSLKTHHMHCAFAHVIAWQMTQTSQENVSVIQSWGW